TGRRPFHSRMPDTGADGARPAGNGSSNSIESGAIRYELSKRNGTGSFDQRQSACDPGNLPLRLRRAALRIHGRCNRLRAAQNIHRRVPARRRRRLLRCSGAAVTLRACSPHATRLRIHLESATAQVSSKPAAFTAITIPCPRRSLGGGGSNLTLATAIALKSHMHFPLGLT